MAKETNLRIEVVFEISEDRLRDIFEEQDIKFTKKKMKEIADDFENGFDQSELEESFEEAFTSFLVEYYGE